MWTRWSGGLYPGDAYVDVTQRRSQLLHFQGPGHVLAFLLRMMFPQGHCFDPLYLNLRGAVKMQTFPHPFPIVADVSKYLCIPQNNGVSRAAARSC